MSLKQSLIALTLTLLAGCASTAPSNYDQKDEALRNITKPDDTHFSEKDDIPFLRKVPLEFITAATAITTKEGKPFLSDGLQLKIIYEAGKDAAWIEQWVDLYDSSGGVMCDGYDLTLLAQSGISKSNLLSYISITGAGSGYVLEMNQIIPIATMETMTIERINLLVEYGFTGDQIYALVDDETLVERFTHFSDTEKPNAVVIFPTYDHNGAFNRSKALNLAKNLAKEYDTLFRRVETDQEAFDAIKSVPNIDLLILAGHGTPTMLTLGDNPSQDRYIDTGDVDVYGPLQNCTNGATIFLYSCLTAGKATDGNLATLIKESAPKGVNVIASPVSFTQDEFTITQLNPFTVEWSFD